MSTSRHLTFANVASLLALVVALGTGGAYAANTVRSKDIVNGQVKAVDLRENAVTTVKIKDGNVTHADLAGEAVDSARVKNGSLGQVDLGTGSVGTAEIADSTVDGGEVADNSLFAADIGSTAVGNSELADNAVDTGNVVNETLTFSDIVGGVTTGNVSFAAGAVPIGRCEQFNFSVGGASPGDGVVFSVRGAMQDGLFLYGMSVLAADTVRASLCNFSGVAQAAITDLPVRITTFR